ncbi:hypothetical protein GCM10027580_06640 [Corynebacterium faecale]|uniref:phosphoribosyltransferase-like protein n=1 Tax=Corynebacterium faecale TaxID=1758466 RepID=UPI0025B563B0|nr:hypothetical protein [Corynebacterium faecale]
MDIAKSEMAQEWLQNFSKQPAEGRFYSDWHIAQKLLSEIQFQPTDVIRNNISKALFEMLESGRINAKIFPTNVISLKEIPPVPNPKHAEEIEALKGKGNKSYKEWKDRNKDLFKNSLNIKDVNPFSLEDQLRFLKEKHRFPPANVGYFQHCAFETFYPNQPALHSGDDMFATAPGSEAITANLLGKLSAEMENEFLKAAAGEDEVIEEARTVLLIADFAGTGTQILQYARTFLANKRVKERRKAGKLKIALICYASTPLAQKWIEINSDHFDEHEFIQGVPTLATLHWSSREMEDLREFLTKHAFNKEARNKFSFGFQRSGALFCSGFSIPNNLPIVLRQSYGPTPNWHPLFTHQNISREFSGIPATGSDEAILINNHPEFEPGPSLSAAKRSSYYVEVLKLIDILFILFLNKQSAGPPLDIAELSGKLGVDMNEIERRLKVLEKGQFIDRGWQLTQKGVDELHYMQKTKYRKKYFLRTVDKVYYPHSLRLGEDW